MTFEDLIGANVLPTENEVLFRDAQILKHFRGEIGTLDDFNDYRKALELENKKFMPPRPIDLLYREGFDCEGQVVNFVWGLQRRYTSPSHIIHKLVVLEGLEEKWVVGIRGGEVTGPGIVIGDAIGFDPLTEIVKIRYMNDYKRYTEVELAPWEPIKWRGHDELGKAIA